MRPRRYDIITSEPSWPLASAVSPLFTKEFYEVARSRLEPGGVFCQWAPQYLLPKEDFMTLFKTFDSVFPGAQVWWLTENGEETGDLFIVGTKDGTSPPREQIEQTVRDLLAERGLDTITLEARRSMRCSKRPERMSRCSSTPTTSRCSSSTSRGSSRARSRTT